MAIAYQAVVIRSPRRLRLRFSNSLAAGAFVTSWYSLSSLDELGAAPAVVEALLVTSSPNEVELHLSTNLVGGAGYNLAVAAGVPATDASTTSAANQEFRPPAPRQGASASFSANDLTLLTYGEDIVWDGNDFVEGPDHDLAVVSGPENVKGAVLRSLPADGLPYDATYGGRLRPSVDAPISMSGVARKQAEQAIRRDSRVKSATVTKVPDANDGDVGFEGQIILIGGTAIPLSS